MKEKYKGRVCFAKCDITSFLPESEPRYRKEHETISAYFVIIIAMPFIVLKVCKVSVHVSEVSEVVSEYVPRDAIYGQSILCDLVMRVPTRTC